MFLNVINYSNIISILKVIINGEVRKNTTFYKK